GESCVMDAEIRFLSTLKLIHEKFPKLKIVMEHVTCGESLRFIQKLNSTASGIGTVGATITLHHLDLTIDDVVGSPGNFCKPVAKYPSDREALCDAVRQCIDYEPDQQGSPGVSGKTLVFLGTDSAPHSVETKTKFCRCSAGI